MLADEAPHTFGKLPEPCPHLPRLEPFARHVRGEEKKREHEDEIPERAEWSDQTIAFARRCIEWHERRDTEQGLARIGIGHDQACDDGETEETADITDSPAGAG